MHSSSGLATGGPGIPARWTSSAKTGVGTALSNQSRVWFTLSHGIFNEIYYPRIDQACTRDMGLIVTDGGYFFSEEKRDADHKVEWLADGVPAFRLLNTCRKGRYQIEKQIVTDPRRDTVLRRVRFGARQGALSDYHLHVLLAPHLGNHGGGNTAWVEEFKGTPLLLAERNGCALALACSAPWIKRSAGYVGSSDGWRDLEAHNQMTWEYSRAENGNVALTAEIDLSKSQGNFVRRLVLAKIRTKRLGMPSPACTPDAHDRRLGVGDISADNRHQYGHLLRSHNLQVRGHCRHRSRDPGWSGIDHGDVAFPCPGHFPVGPGWPEAFVVNRGCRSGCWPGDHGRGFPFPTVGKFQKLRGHRRPGDLCRLFCLWTRADLLAVDLRDLSPKKSRCGHERRDRHQLGNEPAVAVTFLTLVGVLGHAGTFWLYGAIAVVAWVFFYLLVPETKGKSLEQIEEHWRSGKKPLEMGSESSSA
jgi:hypothetical protein